MTVDVDAMEVDSTSSEEEEEERKSKPRLKRIRKVMSHYLEGGDRGRSISCRVP
jgi:hypothetical protein